MSLDEQLSKIDRVCGNCKHYEDEDDNFCIKCNKPIMALKALDHHSLCLLAARFVQQHLYHCHAYPWRILIEPGVRKELPDVFAFTRYNSVLFECKASRSDFLRDKKKPFRANPSLGVGETRYYLVNEGIAKEDEMPKGWYLFEALDENTIRVPKGFTCMGIGSQLDIGSECNTMFQIRNASAEAELMWSWEYRRDHNCLPVIPTEKVNIIRRSQEASK